MRPVAQVFFEERAVGFDAGDSWQRSIPTRAPAVRRAASVRLTACSLPFDWTAGARPAP